MRVCDGCVWDRGECVRPGWSSGAPEVAGGALISCKSRLTVDEALVEALSHEGEARWELDAAREYREAIASHAEYAASLECE